MAVGDEKTRWNTLVAFVVIQVILYAFTIGTGFADQNSELYNVNISTLAAVSLLLVGCVQVRAHVTSYVCSRHEPNHPVLRLVIRGSNSP